MFRPAWSLIRKDVLPDPPKCGCAYELRSAEWPLIPVRKSMPPTFLLADLPFLARQARAPSRRASAFELSLSSVLGIFVGISLGPSSMRGVTLL